jgi:phosphohistidine phosphatase SixA
MRVELWVVRHGAAAERGPAWPDDGLRPLLPKGERQARRLRSVLPTLDRLFASPLTRAAQTAAPLAELAPAGVETLAALAHAEPQELPAALSAALRTDASAGTPDAGTRGRTPRVAIVGHEPQLSEAIGLLITDGERPAAVRMRKGSVARLSGTLRPGGMRLELLLSQSDLKRLG